MKGRKYWCYTLGGRRIRFVNNHRTTGRPRAVQVGDKAWQIGRAVIMLVDGRLQLLNVE